MLFEKTERKNFIKRLIQCYCPEYGPNHNSVEPLNLELQYLEVSVCQIFFSFKYLASDLHVNLFWYTEIINQHPPIITIH